VTEIFRDLNGWPPGHQVEAFKFSCSTDPKDKAKKVLTKFQNPLMKDSGRKLDIAQFDEIYGLGKLPTHITDALVDALKVEHGQFVVLLSEEPTPRTGGWTSMGRVRERLGKFLVTEELISKPTGFDFLWVVDFPLFSPSVDNEPGQGGSAGFAATHHPFTAPKTVEDLDLLATNPLAAKAAHYDFVVNGVELGGGSRRIHNGHVQEYILRDILRVPEEGIKSLQHLLDALKVGCPPHAGIALGFDRLLAVLLGYESVKDVIAFPKNNKGEDPMVGSPNSIRPEQLMPYHLSMVESEDKTLESEALKTSLPA
jgi:aspartyl-tRNA synthetase